MFLTGLFMTSAGVPVFLWCLRILYLLSSNSRLRLNGNLTEENIAAIAIIGAVAAVIGIALMIFGKVSSKSKAISVAIANAGKANYCSHCHVNVDAKDGICPICNQKIGG